MDSKNKAAYTLPKDEIKHQTLKSNYVVDSLASITLKEVKPNYLKYQSNNTNDGFAVFSEVYYGNGWKVLE